MYTMTEHLCGGRQCRKGVLATSFSPVSNDAVSCFFSKSELQHFWLQRELVTYICKHCCNLVDRFKGGGGHKGFSSP